MLLLFFFFLQYLAGSLDAEDGHPRVRVSLELVDQLDTFRGRDAAVDADVPGLKEEEEEEQKKKRKHQLSEGNATKQMSWIKTSKKKCWVPFAQAMKHLQRRNQQIKCSIPVALVRMKKWLFMVF